ADLLQEGGALVGRAGLGLVEQLAEVVVALRGHLTPLTGNSPRGQKRPRVLPVIFASLYGAGNCISPEAPIGANPLNRSPFTLFRRGFHEDVATQPLAEEIVPGTGAPHGPPAAGGSGGPPGPHGLGLHEPGANAGGLPRRGPHAPVRQLRRRR